MLSLSIQSAASKTIPFTALSLYSFSASVIFNFDSLVLLLLMPWDGEVWLHGAIGWRMPLSGWRAAYTGDVLGWHDRARTHFNAYAASQVTEVPNTLPHPAQDSALHLARSVKKWT